MKTKTDSRVYKDAAKLPKHIQVIAANELENLENAINLNELDNVVPIKGTKKPYYRLRFNDYRFLLYLDDDTVEVISLTHRKDTYKKQNLPWRR